MESLLRIISEYPQGVSPGEIEPHLSISRATLNRRLKKEVARGTLFIHGKGPSTRYTSADPLATLRAYFEKPYTERSVAPYKEDRLNIEPGIRPDDLVGFSTPFRPLHKRDLSQFLIDFSCASSALEGGTYSLLDTQALIEYGERNNDKPLADAYLILNHKKAFEFLYDNPHLNAIHKVHALLTDDHGLPELADAQHFLPKAYRGIPREYEDVNIKFSAYLPPFRPGTGYLGKTLDIVLDKAKGIENPIQAAFYLLTRIPYLQPFRDGNKRTARAMCNVPLLQAGLPPVSFVDFNKKDYIVSMLAFYELGDVRMAQRCFLAAYKKSQERLLGCLRKI